MKFSGPATTFLSSGYGAVSTDFHMTFSYPIMEKDLQISKTKRWGSRIEQYGFWCEKDIDFSFIVSVCEVTMQNFMVFVKETIYF